MSSTSLFPFSKSLRIRQHNPSKSTSFFFYFMHSMTCLSCGLPPVLIFSSSFPLSSLSLFPSLFDIIFWDLECLQPCGFFDCWMMSYRDRDWEGVFLKKGKEGVWNEVWSKILMNSINLFNLFFYFNFLRLWYSQVIVVIGSISDQASFLTPTFPGILKHNRSQLR